MNKINFEEYLKEYDDPSSADDWNGAYCVLGGLLSFLELDEVKFPGAEWFVYIIKDRFGITLNIKTVTQIINYNDTRQFDKAAERLKKLLEKHDLIQQ